MFTTQNHDALVAFGQKHVTKGLGRQVEGVMVKGEGSYVTYGDGRRFLDFTSGIGVTNLGEYTINYIAFSPLLSLL